MEKTVLVLAPGQNETIDMYVYNLGDVDIRIDVRLEDIPELVHAQYPELVILRAEKTKTPRSDPDLYWYLMEDGETYAPGKKMQLDVKAPEFSDTLYAGIFSAKIAIEAHAIDSEEETVRAVIGYEQNYPLKVHIVDDPLPLPKEINLSYGEQPTQQEKRKSSQQQATEKYAVLQLNSTPANKEEPGKNIGVTTGLIALLGIGILVYLLKR